LRKYKSKTICALLTVVYSAFACPARSQDLNFAIPKYPPTFKQLLSESWQGFRAAFVNDEGRVQEANAKSTSSESASYALLIAAFQDDKTTFDRIWKWISTNLVNVEPSEYGAFGWHIDYADDGRTILSIKHESATDADQDIAFALIIASFKWNDDAYRESAIKILNQFWDKNTVEVLGKRYVTAGDWASKLDNPRLNPSYFAPYEYRVFAAIDPTHPWMSLVDTSYEVLSACQRNSRLGLPPDWCNIQRSNGAITMNPFSGDSAYSYDAIRVPWRLAADNLLFGEKRALPLIQQMRFLVDSWKLTRAIKGGYSPTGVVIKPEEPLVALSTAMPAIKLIDSQSASEILTEKLIARYRDGIFRPAEIYNNAWAYFSIALSSGELRLPDKLQALLNKKQ
jgi:endoglucanase